MKKQLMIDYILYLIAKFVSALLAALPVGAALKVGRLFGTLAYFFNYKRAKVAYSNMRAAFCKEKDPSEIRRIVKSLYKNFGETLVEVLRIPKVNTAYIQKYVSIENAAHLDNALKKNHGVVFLTGHFGNWELSSITSAVKGYSLLVLAREQKMSRLNNALNEYRESKGCKVVKKGMGAREIYEHLNNNGIVGILADQDAGKKGVFVNFFGRSTSTARGAFALSRTTGAVIIPTFIIRIRGPYHKLILESPIEVIGSDSGELEAAQRFVSLLEVYVRKYPEQWLWLHKRWKSTPSRKVVILSDGKRGHINQSMAVYERIKDCRRESGYSDEDAALKIIDVKYKTKMHRAAIAILTSFVAKYSKLRMRTLELCLSKRSYEELKESYADIVLSCGSETACINVLFSRENSAKSIVLMKPNLISSKNFDLAIIPQHDNPRKSKNLVVTSGVPNLVTPERLERDLNLLRQNVNLDGKRNIGLFIGGENRHYAFDTLLMEEVIENIIDAAKALDMNTLVTTSRRTGGIISDFLKKRLKNVEPAKLVIIAEERNPEWAVGGILAASDIVVVSGESNSMLSEAASSGKHVVVFRPRKKTQRDNKHEIFLSQLGLSGFVHISEVSDLKKNIVKLANSCESPKRLDDSSKIYEAVKRII